MALSINPFHGRLITKMTHYRMPQYMGHPFIRAASRMPRHGAYTRSIYSTQSIKGDTSSMSGIAEKGIRRELLLFSV